MFPWLRLVSAFVKAKVGRLLNFFFTRVTVLAIILLSLWILSTVSIEAENPSLTATESPLVGAVYVENQLIIKFVAKVDESKRGEFRSNSNLVTLKNFPLIGAELVQISGMTVKDAIDLLKKDPHIQYVEPNYIWQADIIPNDPYFNLLWGMHNTGQTGGKVDADIDAVEAWNISTGDSVIIGVIDTGVDTAHVDLLSNIWTNPGEIPNNGIDDDGNGYVDDIHGWDFVNWDNGPIDDNGHGTHCSGTIAAVGNNSIGVVGVCWSAKIMALKFLDSGGYGSTANAILALEYATKMGANLTSNSWGGGSFSQALKNAIDSSGAHGMLFVAAAGNDQENNDIYPHYPCSYDLDNIISVAATDHNDNLAYFSNWGLVSVDLGAPGVDIYSSLPGNSYGYGSGTSMACPHVSGACALVWSEYPGLTHLQVKNRILNFADPMPSLAGKCVSGGRLNAFMSLTGPESIPPSPISDLAVIKTEGSKMALSWTATGDDSTTGTAYSYDVRYSLLPIDSLNFDLATQVVGEPQPKPAGSPETLVVRGLNFNTTYYFAIKAFDEWNNASGVSNSPWGTTLGPPDISVSPDSLRDSLFTGEKSIHLLTISNIGVSDLIFGISITQFSSSSNVMRVIRERHEKNLLPLAEPIMPHYSTEKPDEFRDGQKVGDYSSTASAEINEFPQIMGDWKSRAPMIQARGQHGLVAHPNGKIYAFGGYAGGSEFSSLEIYDPVTDSWSSGSPMPQADRGIATAIDNNGNIYAFTAIQGSSFRYNPSSNNWSTISPPPVIGAWEAGAAKGLDGRIYLIGGEGGSSENPSNLVQICDPVTNSWSTGSPMPTPRYQLGVVCGSSGFIYAIGGRSSGGGSPLNVVEVYDPQTNSWSSATPMPTARNQFAISLGADGKIYTIGGKTNYLNNTGPFFDVVEIYDPLSDTWETGPPLPTQRGEMEAVLCGYGIYSIGGTNSSFLSLNQMLETLGWLSVNPASGTIPAGNSMDIAVTFNATGLNGGDYSANIIISSNDPDEPKDTILAHLHVTGAPDIAVDSDSLNFGIVYIGYPESLPLLVSNEGTDILTVTGIVPDLAEFSVDITNFVLAPGEDTVLNIAFAPTVVGEVWSNLTISSDDPDEPTLMVSLRGQGLVCPNVWVDPPSVLDSLFTGETSVETLTVGNSGESPLYFKVELDNFVGPTAMKGVSSGRTVTLYKGSSSISDLLGDKGVRKIDHNPDAKTTAGLYELGQDGFSNISANPGDVLASWPAPSPIQGPWGLGFDGHEVWVSDYMGITDNEVSTAGVLLFWFSCSGWVGSWPGDMDWDGNYIWQVNVGGDNGIYKLDPANGNVLGSIHDPSHTWDAVSQRGLAYDKKTDVFYIGGWNQDRVYKIKGPSWDHPGEILSSFDFPNISGLAWHPAGTLWIAVNASTDYIFQVNPETGSIISQFLAPGTGGGYEGAGLAIDKQGDLWCISQVTHMVYLVESGVPAYQWLTVTLDACTLGVGETKKLEVRFDATGFFGGNYSADILIQSNDCDQPSLAVPASLHVTGAPDIVISEDTLVYGNVFIGASVFDTLIVSNQGTDLLTVSSISSDNPDYTVDTTSFALNPKESHKVLVAFTPSEAGAVTATLTIASNDPDESTIIVVLRGEGIVPPDIAISPDSLSDVLIIGESSVDSLTIYNPGGSDLTFDISIKKAEGASVLARIHPISLQKHSDEKMVGESSFSTKEINVVRITQAGHEDSPVLSNQTPADYQPRWVKVSKTAGVDDVVLIIQDLAPWGSTANEQILSNNGIDYQMINSSNIPMVNFLAFPVILIPSDQPTSFYQTIASFENQFNSYVTSGGILEFHCAGWGWNGGNASLVTLPGGMNINQHSSDSNYVLDPSHPLVNGVPNPFTGGPSLAYFTNIPANAEQIVEDDFGNTNLVEYTFGGGVVIASGQTLEFGFDYGQGAGIILTNMIPYAYGLGGIGWLSADPTSGTISEGSSLNITVIFDALNTSGVDYSADLAIISNDPDEGKITVPVHMRVVNIGDVTADFKINLSDVIYLANYQLKGGPAPKSLLSADVFCDSHLDLTDVIWLADHVIRGWTICEPH
jgi:subtilisin family serine protease